MRSGISYFPLDVELDTKFELIEAEFGLTGFAVVVKLFQRIYGEQGYYGEWTEEVALLFSRRVGLGGNVVSEIVTAAIKRGIFDKTLYDKYQILTSRGIQERYFEIVSRRKSVKVKKQYLLACVTKKYNNVDISSENVNISNENVDISKQSKVKKSKVKKSKVKESKVKECGSNEPAPTPKKHKYGEFKNVLLTADEYSKITAEPNGTEAIEFLSAYIAEKPYKSKSHYLAIRRWVLSAVAERQTAKPKKEGLSKWDD